MAYVHPRGSTFDLSGIIDIAEQDVPVTSLAGWTVRAKVRSEISGVGYSLTATWLNAAARQVRVTGSSAGWPLGTANLYLKLTSPTGTVVEPNPTSFVVGLGFDDA